MSAGTRPALLVLGATSAIAQATIRLYAGQGASLFLVARSPDKLAVVAADARVRGASEIYTQPLDLDDIGAHKQLVEEAFRTMPGLTVVLLAHGILGEQPEAERDFIAAQRVLHTNFIGPASLLTLIANEFESRGGGTIAVISSVAGDRGRKSNYVYGASKGALTIFLAGLRNRLDRKGVQVLTIEPGFVSTPMTAHLDQGFLFASPEKIAQGIVTAIERKKDIVYLPWFWRPIMSIIGLIPERIFKRMNL